MKRQHKTATIRRLVALTMLSSLLFSSTAVYADTADDETVAVESGEVVETGNTSDSNTTSGNSSNNLNDTVSGNDSIEDNSNTTTENNDDSSNEVSEDEVSEDEATDSRFDLKLSLGESKLLSLNFGGLFGPSCDHDNLDDNNYYYQNCGNNQHELYKKCKDCEEYVATGEKSNHNWKGTGEYAHKKNKHQEKLVCKDCGVDTYGEEVQCSSTTASYVSEGAESHRVSGKCDTCEKDFSYKEGCTFVPAEGNSNIEYCEKDGCLNVKVTDSRNTKPEIKAEASLVSGTADDTETFTEDGVEYTAFDKKMKLKVTATIEALNDATFDDVASALTAKLYVTDNNNSNVITLAPESFDKGVAVFEWTSETEYSSTTYVNGVVVEYKLGEKLKNGSRSDSIFKEGSDNKTLNYILRNVNEDCAVADFTAKITGGNNWKLEGNNIWYSKAKNSEDLTITYTGKTVAPMKANTVKVVEVDESGNTKSTENINRIEVKSEKKIEFDGWFLVFPKFKTVYYNTIKYQVPADVDGQHTYKISFDVLGKTHYGLVSTYVDNTAPKLKVTFDNSSVKNKKYYKANRTATFVLEDTNIDGNEANMNYVQVEAKDGYATVNPMIGADGKYTGSIEFNQDGTYSISGINFVDKAGNNCKITDDSDKNYSSEFVIDKTAPTLKITFDNHSASHEKYYKDSRTATFVFEDKNIDATEADMSVVTINAKGGKVTVNKMTGADGKYTGSIVFDQDGIYSINLGSLKFADKAGNVCELSADTDANYAAEFVIDKTAPKVDKITYSNPTGKTGRYYNKDVEISVEVNDTNLSDESYITTKVDNKESNDKVHLSGNTQGAATINYTAKVEGKHVLVGKIYDLAGNYVEINDTDKEFVIDKTAPTVEEITYSKPTGKTGRFYKNDVAVSVKVKDLYLSADSYITTVLGKDSNTESGEKANLSGDTNGSGKIELTVTKESEHKLVGKIYDLAGNYTDINDSENYFEIDKTVPVISVKFDNNSALNGNYFKAARRAEITITEKNFNADQVTYDRSSGNFSVLPSMQGFSSNDGKNVSHITFDKDGNYGFTLVCEDKAGNLSEKFVSEEFVIDMTLPELEISGVTDMSANNGKVEPVITSKDANLTDACTEITLTGSNRGKVSPNMTKTKGDEIFTYSFADMAHEKSNDDLYTLTVKLTDLAGNSVEKKVQYSLNRFGSVFALSEATKAMVDGYYVTKPQDVVITEINVDAITKKEVSVAFDGSVKELSEGSAYTAKDETKSNGWHAISYTVSKSNFNKDGIYSVNVYSEDKATNKQSSQTEAQVEFLLDKTAPSVVVSGLEDGGIYEEESHDFSVNAADTIGVTDMKIYLNDQKLASYSAAELTANGGTAVLTIPTKDDYQKVTIQCSDVAGNVTKIEYNNVLVSPKAQELLLEDNLTPTAKIGDEDAAEILVNNASKALVILGIIAALLAVVGGVVIVKRKNS